MQTILPVILQVLQLGIGDLAIDLRQRLEAAHREQRVAEGDQDGDRADLRPDRAAEPAERVRAELQIAAAPAAAEVARCRAAAS